ncbi:MAG: RluA family pseudouridine synthase [Acidobacteria bacterium]|nr:MAG: RluA family pseudouridine synthase [Acidobacteriota bacterium]
MERLEVEVPPDAAGERLDRFLVTVIVGQSRSQIQRLVREGRVVVAGHQARPNTPVRAGDRIVVEVPARAPSAVEAEPLELPIVYQDSDLVVVDKPAGMVVHPAAGHSRGTLVNALLYHVTDLSGIGGEDRPGIVHRLDRGTSGLMVVAKHDSAHRELARQFHDREVEKCYLALAWGLVHQGRRIDQAIGRDPASRERMSSRARHARSAVTRVVRAEYLEGVSLLEVVIQTGRTHQIRAHLSGIGHPIVGDPLYGGVRRRVPGHLRAVQRLERPFLHAARLSFTHPITATRLTFESPLPGDLDAVLGEVRRQSENRGAG